MSKGNLQTAAQGGKNMPYQFNVLRLLGAISGTAGTLATEATLLQVLAALQNGQEFEQNLVIDTGDPACAGGNCPTYFQVRIWDIDTHTFGPPRYFNVNGVEMFIGGNPLYGPMQIVNPQLVLNNILAELVAINADLDVALSTRASEATVSSINTLIGSINTKFDVNLSTVASEATLAAGITAILVALGTLATETTLSAVNTKLTPAARTHNYVNSSGVGTVPAGSLRGSVLNSGNAAGVWNGGSIPAGISIPWGDIFSRDTYGVIAFDASGTTFLIEYTT